MTAQALLQQFAEKQRTPQLRSVMLASAQRGENTPLARACCWEGVRRRRSPQRTW